MKQFSEFQSENKLLSENQRSDPYIKFINFEKKIEPHLTDCAGVDPFSNRGNQGHQRIVGFEEQGPNVILIVGNVIPARLLPTINRVDEA